MVFLKGIMLNPFNKVHGSHKLKILWLFILRHKTYADFDRVKKVFFYTTIETF